MILHIDMDAFYASVEQLDNPELKGRCIIVGGSTNRGVVSAASYEARRHGVHSAMPIFQARQRCPGAVFIRPRMHRYKEVSNKVMAVLRKYSPLLEQVSIDEAYMDISGCERLLGDPETIGRKIKAEIRQTLGLTCSVGIAPNRFLAKIASDSCKPDGLTIIPPSQVAQFVRALPVEKVPGVGQKTHRRLEKLGIRTLGDVNGFSEKALCDRLGKYGRRLLELAAGIDTTPVQPDSPHKSVSSEQTFAADTDDLNRLSAILLQQAEEVSRQLRRQGVRARTITLKIKHSDFRQVTRSTTLAEPIRSSDTIFAESLRLLERYRLTRKIRLIGIGASNFADAATPKQLSLFDSGTTKKKEWEKVDETVDRITAKFGKEAVLRGTLRKDS
jgi:DNA polymerase-4